MEMQTEQPLRELWTQIANFLPTLAAGLLVLALGIVAGWLVKRAVIRVLIWLRLDRLAGRAGWRAAFGKGDVRSTVYNLVGNLAMLIVVLVFLDDALERLGLLALARIIDSAVFFLPNLGLVALIVAIGLWVSTALEARVTETLEDEGVERARLIGKLVKALLVSVIVAISLWQIRLAREIVLAAFLIGFGSLGVAFALGVGLGSYRAVERGFTSLFRRKDDA